MSPPKNSAHCNIGAQAPMNQHKFVGKRSHGKTPGRELKTWLMQAGCSAFFSGAGARLRSVARVPRRFETLAACDRRGEGRSGLRRCPRAKRRCAYPASTASSAARASFASASAHRSMARAALGGACRDDALQIERGRDVLLEQVAFGFEVGQRQVVQVAAALLAYQHEIPHHLGGAAERHP